MPKRWATKTLALLGVARASQSASAFAGTIFNRRTNARSLTMPETTMNTVNDEALDAVIDADLYGFDTDTGMTDEELDVLLESMCEELTYDAR